MQAKFEEIAAHLRQAIEAGVYMARLPSEQDLARALGTTTNTLRKAQALLIAEGRLVKRQPQGTFITTPQRPVIRVSLLLSLFTPPILAEIGAQFRKEFPQVDVEFHTRLDHRVPTSECDLIGVGNLCPVACSDIAVPFPAAAMAGLPASHYFEPAFNVHRLHGLCYGLPVLFSPVVLAADRRVLEAEGIDREPYSLDARALEALAAAARKRNLALWDAETVSRLMRSLVFAAAAEPGVLWSVDKQRLRLLLQTWEPWLSGESVAAGKDRFCEGKALTGWTCRQGLHRLDPDRTTLFAWPRELRHCAGVAGEFLLLNRASRYRKEAVRVALHFLSPPIQAILVRNGIGLPVVKGVAVDCLGKNPWRDDVFLTEVQHICANSAREHEFLHRLEGLTGDLIAGTATVAQAVRVLDGEIDLARRRHASRRTFMVRHAEPVGEPVLALG
jgi:hypothetical protein